MKAEDVPTQFIKAGGFNFAYRIIGEGFPIVLFHRYRATMDEWDPAFINYLAQKNQVIIFDNIGVGLTEGITPNTITAIAEAGFIFSQALGLKKFNILGWSLGGAVAQVFVLNYEEVVKKVVLVGTGPAWSPETVFPSERFLEIAKHETNPPEDHQVLFFTEDENGKKETLQSLQRIALRQQPWIPPTRQESWASQSIAARDFFSSTELFGKLKNINKPVLIGAAKQDIAFPPIDSYLLAREIPDSQLIVYSNAGHGFHHQYHKHFGDLVNEFLS